MSPKKRAAKEQPREGLPADVAQALGDLLGSLQNRAEGAQISPGGAKADRAPDGPGPAAKLLEAARLLQEAAAELGREPLPAGSQSGNHKTMLEPARLHRSEGALNTGDRVARFLEVAKPVGHTLRSIAAAVGMKHPHLGNVLRGTKRMRPSWALQIQALTRSQIYPNGFEATRANYPHPRGWVGED